MVAERARFALRDDGGPRGTPPLRDGEFCLWHDPDHAQVAEARRLGGLRRRSEVAVSGAYDFDGLDSIAKVRRLLEVAVIDTLGLENSIARARTLAYLAQTAVKLLEAGEIEDRLKLIEEAVGPRLVKAGRR